MIMGSTYVPPSRFDTCVQPLGYILPTPPPSSPLSVTSDVGSQSSAASIASSQTSYSSVQWPCVEVDPEEPSGSLGGKLAALGYPQTNHNPRRTYREGPPPSLTRQNERKGQFVYHLVDSATCLVETIWPTSAPACLAGSTSGHQSMLPLRTFIEETLRRSKTSFSTLQVALFYLILLKEHVPAFDFTMEQSDDSPVTRALQCGRRMFLAALILGSKYLQDRNYSARAWSKISGLQVTEINLNERAFLAAVKWKLHIPEATFNRWQDILVKYSHPTMVDSWRYAIRALTPEYIEKTPQVTPPYSPQQLFKTVDWRRNTAPSSPVDVMAWNQGSPTPACSSPLALESRLAMRPPPAPSALKLPTPSPMSTFCPTPAVNSASDMLRGPRSRAMCMAMNAASNIGNARTCIDLAPTAMGLNGAPGRFSRRSSLASCVGISSASDSTSPSTTSSPRSSPGSMVSDHSSRSSSVSSTSSYSQNTSPIRNQLPRLARMNAAYKLVDSTAAAPFKLDDSVAVLSSEPLTTSHFTESPEVIVIEDDATPTQSCYDVSRESRKRHRCSVDSGVPASVGHGVQDQVRMLMCRDQPLRVRTGYGNELNKPAAKKYRGMSQVGGRENILRPSGGPGMWSGILS